MRERETVERRLPDRSCDLALSQRIEPAHGDISRSWNRKTLIPHFPSSVITPSSAAYWPNLAGKKAASKSIGVVIGQHPGR